MTRLHRIQNSVWAGELSRIEWNDLDRALKERAGAAKVQAWLFPSPPTVHHYGRQDDEQSMFL